MFSFDTYLTMQVFLLNIYRSHLSCKIFGFDCYCRKEAGERSLFGCTNPTFHYGSIKTK